MKFKVEWKKFVSELFSSVVNGLLFVLLTLRNM